MTEFSDLKSFVDSWEDRFVEVTEFDVFKNSPKGNINKGECVGLGDIRFHPLQEYSPSDLSNSVQV